MQIRNIKPYIHKHLSINCKFFFKIFAHFCIISPNRLCKIRKQYAYLFLNFKKNFLLYNIFSYFLPPAGVFALKSLLW